MIDGLHACDSPHQLRVVALDVFDELVLLDPRTGDEDRACYVQNLMSYLHGRELTDDEQATVDYFARVSRAGMISLHDLELAIVTSDAFLNRLP